MASFVVYPYYTKRDGQRTYNDLLKWFKAHPERKDCRTDRALLTRENLKKVVQSWCQPGVKLTEPKRLTSKFSKGAEDLYAKKKSKAKKTKKSKK